MKRSIPSNALRCLLALAGAIPLAASGEVVISEVLFNELGANVGGEFIEIYNNGPETVSLQGWSLGDEETQGAQSLTEAMMLFPDDAVIEPGQFLVIAANAYVFAGHYGFDPDFEGWWEDAEGNPGYPEGDNPDVPNLTTDWDWDPDGGIINMSNTNDHVFLRNAEGTVVDRVAWGNTTSPNLDPNAEADGQSWYRIDPTTDTDSPEDWALTPLEIRSTPGTQPVAVVFDAVIEDSAFGPLLRWNEAGGSVTYRVQMSEDLQEWTDEALELTELEWPLPRPLPPQVFFRVWADAAN